MIAFSLLTSHEIDLESRTHNTVAKSNEKAFCLSYPPALEMAVTDLKASTVLFVFLPIVSNITDVLKKSM